MARKRLLWQVFPVSVLILAAAFLIAEQYTRAALHRFFLEQTARDLHARAILAAVHVRDTLAADGGDGLPGLVRSLGHETGTRITIVATNGVVLVDSERDAAAMENHASRPEVREALSGRAGREERFSDTTREMMMFVAVPVTVSNEVRGVVRTAVSVSAIDTTLGGVQRRLLLLAVFVLAALLLASYAMLRRISGSIDSLQQGSRRFAGGDLGFRLPVPDSAELGGLAETMNRMAAQLDERIQALAAQGNEQHAVLSSMAEGVMAVNSDERLLQMNEAAARLLGIKTETAVGRDLTEVIRVPGIQRIARDVLGGTDLAEVEFTLPGDEERFVQVRGAALRDAAGRNMGALLVLNDLTQIRRLERVRRDFVANVSHELKTPLTTIKGFVETLDEGAVEQPENARRFLKIINAHVERLQNIVEDLLSLARIEEEAERAQIALADAPIHDVLAAAVAACSGRAEAKQIRISLGGDKGARARLNAPLLEQAVVNLIDNAIKYSEPGTQVEVSLASGANGDWQIGVSDQGCGIEAQHLDRIFERFYCVDKSRSRSAGGTGLGLSIVKHIVSAHGGRVTVESVPGKGSVFTIHLPRG